MQLLFSIKQAASNLGVGRTTIYELVKIGSKSLITASSLNALVARLIDAKRGDSDASANSPQKSRGA